MEVYNHLKRFANLGDEILAKKYKETLEFLTNQEYIVSNPVKIMSLSALSRGCSESTTQNHCMWTTKGYNVYRKYSLLYRLSNLFFHDKI